MPAVTEQDVLSALKSCYDPEIPVNIVDMGLIYTVRFEPLPEDKQDVTVDMTLTSQGCRQGEAQGRDQADGAGGDHDGAHPDGRPGGACPHSWPAGISRTSST